MAKSTKTITLITLFFVLALLGVSAVFAVQDTGIAFAAEVETTTVAITVTKSGSPFDLAAIEFVPDDASYSLDGSFTATYVAEGSYTITIPKIYTAEDGNTKSQYRIYSKLNESHPYVYYGQYNFYSATEYAMEFVTITQEDGAATPIVNVVAKDSLFTLERVRDVTSSTDLNGDILFKNWTLENPETDNPFENQEANIVASRDKRFISNRIAVDKSWFGVSNNTVLTVRGAADRTVKGSLTATNQALLFTLINNYGNATKTIEITNSSISQVIEVPAGQEITIKGSFGSTNRDGVFNVNGGKLVLDDAEISTTEWTTGVLLDQGEVVLTGTTVNTGGIVVTDNTATSGTLTFDGEVQTEDTIRLAYNNLDYKAQDSDTDTKLLCVSGEEVASKFSLANPDSNDCGMKYDATTGTLYLEEKFFVTYELPVGVDSGSITPTTIYVLSGDSVTLADATGFSMLGHKFLYWAQGGTANTFASGAVISQLTSNLTLRAHFEALQYTITFTGIDLEPMTHTYGVDTEISTPSKLGFSFTHWILDSTMVLPENGKLVIKKDAYSSPDNLNIRLEAVWKLKAPVNVYATGYTGQYDGKTHALTVFMEHELSSVSYLTAWSMAGATSGDLSVKNVADSGTYTCKVTAYLYDNGTYYYSDAVSATATAEITKITLKIAANPAEKEEGDEDPELTFRLVEGTMAEGEDLSKLGVRMSREEGEEKGVYKIKLAYTNSNYQILYAEADFTITQKNLILIIVLPSVFGGLALIGGITALSIVLVKRRKKSKDVEIGDEDKAEKAKKAKKKSKDVEKRSKVDEIDAKTSNTVDKNDKMSKDVEKKGKEKRPAPPKNKSKKHNAKSKSKGGKK